MNGPSLGRLHMLELAVQSLSNEQSKEIGDASSVDNRSHEARYSNCVVGIKIAIWSRNDSLRV